MSANPLRSEREIVIGGKSYRLKPTFDALARIEHGLNRSIFAALVDISNARSCKVSDIVTILECGIAAGLQDPKEMPARVKIGEHVQAMGMAKVLPVLVPWLTDAVATDEDLVLAQEAQAKGESAKVGEA